MRISGTKPGLGILLLAGVGLLWLGGCHNKKATTVPAQAQAPTITEPESAPPAVPTESTHPEIKPATPPPVPATPPRSRSHHGTRKPAAPPATTADAPEKEVVPAGSAPSTGSQLTPSLTPEEAERARQGTVQLLAATEANLQNLAQPLSREEQATVDEIRSYMTQSRAAMAEGDLVRAHNLAGKAHLLSRTLPRK